jgi:ribokinase
MRPEGTTAAPEIVVVGSANVDLVVTMANLPAPGETVLAREGRVLPGGKGSNQAIAAARLGRSVAMIGRTGRDPGGELLRAALAREGVDTAGFVAVEDTPTGQALVLVDDSAENSIVVIPGANALVSAEAVAGAAALVSSAAVVVAQLEVPVEAILAAARLCTGTFVLNAAPAHALAPELLAEVDVLVVNQTEFSVVMGGDADADPDALAHILERKGVPRRIVITRGSFGARVWEDGSLIDVPAPRVNVVDTTGAGDTFVGAFADALARGLRLLDAAIWAVHAASLATQALGATGGMPSADSVRAALGYQPRAG